MSQRDDDRPWLDNDKLVPELHAGEWKYDIDVHIGPTNVVEINSPSARPIRVSVGDGMWTVELGMGGGVWLEYASIPIK